MPSLWEVHPNLLDPAYITKYDFGDSWTRKNPEAAYEDLDVAVALVRETGNLSAAARLLGRSRRSLQGFVLRNLQMKELLEDIQEEFLDIIEAMCRKDALGEDYQARWRFLTTKGKDRGFTTRTESTGADGGAIAYEDVTRDAADFASQMARLASGADEGKAIGADTGAESGSTLDLARVVGKTEPASA